MVKVRSQGMGMHFFNSSYEIKKLQKENEELKMENEILKKFQAFLKRKNARGISFSKKIVANTTLRRPARYLKTHAPATTTF